MADLYQHYGSIGAPLLPLVGWSWQSRRPAQLRWIVNVVSINYSISFEPYSKASSSNSKTTSGVGKSNVTRIYLSTVVRGLWDSSRKFSSVPCIDLSYILVLSIFIVSCHACIVHSRLSLQKAKNIFAVYYVGLCTFCLSISSTSLCPSFCTSTRQSSIPKQSAIYFE